ncbi:Spy/CpxP family protein refolding chaperone [Psychrobacter phenylpyruvicus]|uniref:Periplasmic protein n=1 Tax=Psychrobacter phenylpyruvicus TaxID=29432 RepID=A0A379LJ61_9GAMM|nr:Spy/CpxP family protein refolding chaperone [Psychrobacter phenylpyruvicus]SUD90650.1 Uncharacterised protein [Psychrobacter phenylpyruvicus]
MNIVKPALALVFSGLLITACQTSPTTSNSVQQPVAEDNTLPAATLPDLIQPVEDKGLSVDADSSFPIIELMPFIMTHEKQLELTPAQVEAFATYRKAVMKQRIALQANEKALRGQLRLALIEGADDDITTPLMRRISDTEMAHMELRRNCIKNARAVLTPEQFEKLISLYKTKLNAK